MFIRIVYVSVFNKIILFDNRRKIETDGIFFSSVGLLEVFEKTNFYFIFTT